MLSKKLQILLLTMLLPISLLLSCTPSPPRALEENFLSNPRETVIRHLTNAQKFLQEKKYENTLEIAYKALVLSRKMGDSMLEASILHVISSTHLMMGDNFISSKLMMDSLSKQVDTIDSLGFKKYLNDAVLLAVEFLNNNEEYIFDYMQLDPISSQLLKGISKTDYSELIDKIEDTVAGILDSLWTGQMIAFILPVSTFFPKGAKYVRTG